MSTPAQNEYSLFEDDTVCFEAKPDEVGVVTSVGWSDSDDSDDEERVSAAHCPDLAAQSYRSRRCSWIPITSARLGCTALKAKSALPTSPCWTGTALCFTFICHRSVPHVCDCAAPSCTATWSHWPLTLKARSVPDGITSRVAHPRARWQARSWMCTWSSICGSASLKGLRRSTSLLWLKVIVTWLAAIWSAFRVRTCCVCTRSSRASTLSRARRSALWTT